MLIVNVITSLLHYADNILFFHAYPEPHWISPKLIDAFWFVMTPFAILGYFFYKRGLETYSYLCFYLYSLMSLLVLGHYRYGSMGELSFKINLLILAEAFAALILIFYALSLQLQAKTQPPEEVRDNQPRGS